MKEDREVKKVFKQKKLREIEESLDESVEEEIEDFENKNPIKLAFIDQNHNILYYKDGTVNEI